MLSKLCSHYSFSIGKDGWVITDDPYVISYGERFLFIDLGATETRETGQFIGAERQDQRIAVEIKEFRGRSAIRNLEQAIGQYVLYKLLLDQVDPGREILLAVTDIAYDEIFSEPIGELVITGLPMELLVVDAEKVEVKRWVKANTKKQ